MAEQELNIVMKASDILQKKDFRAAFERVAKLILKIKEDLHDKNLKFLNELEKLHNELYEKLKNTNVAELAEARKKFENLIEKALKEQEQGMNFIYDKVGRIKSGKDGKHADENKIVEKVLDKIQLPEQKEIILDGPEEIANKLETLKGDARLDVSAIKGIEEIIKDVKQIKSRPVGVGTSSRDLFADIDISDELDGSTKTFNIAAVWNIISVDLSSFPYGSLRKNVDYTYTPTSITFTAEIDAATQLAAGQSCVLTVVIS